MNNESVDAFSIIKTFESFADLGAEWVMWLMVILGFVMIVFTFERLLLFVKTKIDAPALARDLVVLLDEGRLEGSRNARGS